MTQGLWASPPQMMVAMAFSFATPIISICQKTGTKQQIEGRQQAMEIRHIRRDASRQAMGDAPGSGQRSGSGNVAAGMSRRLHRRRQSRPDSRCIRRRARSVIPLSVGHSDVGSLLQSVEPGRLAVQSHAAKTCTDCGPRGNFPLDVCVRQI